MIKHGVTKPRFWKKEQHVGRVVSMYFAQGNMQLRNLKWLITMWTSDWSSRRQLVPFFRQSPPLGEHFDKSVNHKSTLKQPSATHPVFDKPAFSRFSQNCEPLIVVEIFGKIVKRQVCQKRGWVADGWFKALFKSVSTGFGYKPYKTLKSASNTHSERLVRP
jgi:hypothetical protein